MGNPKTSMAAVVINLGSTAKHAKTMADTVGAIKKKGTITYVVSEKMPGKYPDMFVSDSENAAYMLDGILNMVRSDKRGVEVHLIGDSKMGCSSSSLFLSKDVVRGLIKLSTGNERDLMQKLLCYDSDRTQTPMEQVKSDMQFIERCLVIVQSAYERASRGRDAKAKSRLSAAIKKIKKIIVTARDDHTYFMKDVAMARGAATAAKMLGKNLAEIREAVLKETRAALK